MTFHSMKIEFEELRKEICLTFHNAIDLGM